MGWRIIGEGRGGFGGHEEEMERELRRAYEEGFEEGRREGRGGYGERGSYGQGGGYGGLPFTRYYADTIGSGTPILWEEMM